VFRLSHSVRVACPWDTYIFRYSSPPLSTPTFFLRFPLLCAPSLLLLRVPRLVDPLKYVGPTPPIRPVRPLFAFAERCLRLFPRPRVPLLHAPVRESLRVDLNAFFSTSVQSVRLIEQTLSGLAILVRSFALMILEFRVLLPSRSAGLQRRLPLRES